MKERPLPYIGISGVSQSGREDINTQHRLTDQLAETGLDHDHTQNRRQLLLGVKAVHKTQYLDIENKYGREWYPVGEEEFKKALSSEDSKGLRAAQIYFDADHVGSAGYRDEFVKRICKRGKNWLNALQFDLLPWQQDDMMLPFIEKVKQDTGHTIILQAHGESMRHLGPDGVAQSLGRYAHVLDYVLFDASHGKGVRMDPDSLMPFLDAAYASEDLAGSGIGVAGGLCTEVVREELPILIAAHPDLSWDAEGKLHTAVTNGSPSLDWAAAKDYLQASAEILQNPS